MNNIPKISVIIPCYNVEKYIDKCINSVINQTYTNIEIVIIDDGSTDNTNKVILNCISSLENVIYIRNENLGVSNARNTGLKNATGEYIMFIDSDDYISNNMIKNMYGLMVKYSSDLVRCNIIKEYTDNNVKKIEKPIYSRVRDINKDKFATTIHKKILSTETMNSICFSLYNSKIIKDNNLKFREDIHNGEDAIFFMNYIDNCKNIVYTPAPYYHYVIKNTGLTGSGLSIEKLWDSKLKFIEELRIKEKKWNLLKYNYVDDKIVYIVVSTIFRLYKKDKFLSNESKRIYLENILNDINFREVLNKVDYTKLNLTDDRIEILDHIKESNIEKAIKVIESI